jgi:hypothetical protein
VKRFFVLMMVFVLLTLAVNSVAAENEPPPEDPRQPSRMVTILEIPPEDPREPSIAYGGTIIGDITVNPT